MPTQINCPTCQKQHNWQSSKPWSPFCSERCKLIDLGAWASEKHVISGVSGTVDVAQENTDSDISKDENYL